MVIYGILILSYVKSMNINSDYYTYLKFPSYFQQICLFSNCSSASRSRLLDNKACN